jgi:signal transduction histidine kinase
MPMLNTLSNWEFVLELTRFMVMAAILILLIQSALSHALEDRKDLWFIITGFVLLLFGSLIDVIDDYQLTAKIFPNTNQIMVVIFEKGIGYLGGFVFIAFGFSRWPPLVAQLRKAKGEASFANSAKTDFLAHMSHELRTPLNSIIGYSEIIREQFYGKLGNEKYIDCASSVHSSGYHLLHLINDILDLSKIEAGEMTIDQEAIDVLKLLDQCVDMIRGSKEAREISICTNYGENIPSIFADEILLKKVVLNLLSNALKFSKSGEHVTISASVLQHGQFTFTVSDTGIGISKEDLPRVLLPFGQARSSVHKTHSGTGLGLSLTKQIVELHGGSLAIESELQKGTTVIVTIPIECEMNREL